MSSMEEIDKVELSEIFSTIRMMYEIRVKVATALLAATTLVIGYSILSMQAGTILICPIFAFGMAFADLIGKMNISPYLYSGVLIEQKYEREIKGSATITTFLSAYYPEFIKNVEKIKKDEEKDLAKLKWMLLSTYFKRDLPIYTLVAISEITLVIVMHYITQWSLFTIV